MASNYTCTACSRALAKSSIRLSQRTNKSSLRRAQRAFSTATRSAYHATPTLSAGVRGEAATQLPPVVKGSATSIAQKLREKAPLMTETYVAYGATRDLIKECTKPGDYKIPQALVKDGEIPVDENGTHIGEAEGWWYDTLGLKPTFSNWSQITFLHMYMLQVRFRMFPKTHAPVWIQHLTNQAFYAAEDRLVIWHKFNANSLRQKQLKDMFSQWRAVLLSYDEGLIKGDAMLAAAVWRNLFSAREDIDFEKLAQIVGYLRRELKRLDMATDDEVASGTWKFKGNPGDEVALVQKKSQLMASPSAKP
ncbi:hypothetical protein T440DRAFT_446385 [Plenodomus tracheiphilus IPT5]|uniref:Ubiquinol-cytochrome c chaperone domain-containing protein n=1 Tax=Plenodomus tracheiphilus IPT5 TaxID=1408161 RepID=A0A6A7BDU1_9PLEO|nr:hypothetical protein T440DRAFT_446385 [Plenodomus tracheiphilus IPT5]